MVLKLVYIITLMIWCIYPLTCAQNHQNQTITSAQNQSETIIAKAGCDSECGNVSIPFPFGMHDTKCFASEWFEIDCRNTASQGEKPYLRLIDLEVIFIDLSGKVWIMNPIIKYCQENFRYLNMMRTVKQLGGGPFVYSKDDNSLVAVGCQNSAYLFSNDSIVSGCVTMCDDDQKQGLSSDVASCRGTYCCETSLSSSLSEYTVRIGTLGLVNMKPLFEGCSYALIRADYKRFPNKFSKRKWVPTIGDLEKNLTEIPAVLEWEILNDTLNNPFPANQYGRYCYPTSVTSPPQSKYTHSGWRCRCQHQHSEGNPYIEGSCKAKPFDPPEPPIIKKKNGAKWAIIGGCHGDILDSQDRGKDDGARSVWIRWGRGDASMQ